MTRTGDALEDVHRRVAGAAGLLALALERRRVSSTALQSVSRRLRSAADRVDQLVEELS